MNTFYLHISKNETASDKIGRSYVNMPATKCWQEYARKRSCYIERTS